MSKALEALEKIKEYLTRYNDTDDIRGIDYENEVNVIETTLKNYEEGLYHAKTYVKHTPKQALYDLLGLALKNVHESYWELPEQLFDDVNKSLKALEIIKETRVDTNIIKESKDYDDYCGLEAQKMLALMFSAPKQKGITEEEYNLLKEVLL